MTVCISDQDKGLCVLLVISFKFIGLIDLHSQRRLCKVYLGRKVNNMPGVNFSFVGTPSFSPRIITCLEPAIQLKTDIWTTVNFQNS